MYGNLPDRVKRDAGSVWLFDEGNRRASRCGWRAATDKTEIPLRARQNARCRMTSLITLASMGIFFPGSALLSKTAGGFGSNVPVLLHLAFTPNMGLEYLH